MSILRRLRRPALLWLGLAAATGLARAEDAPAGRTAVLRVNWYTNAGPTESKHGHGQNGKKCGCVGCYARPYETSSCLYGYQDYVYGRGPLINLGGASLEPGFRGYGVLGSPGYGHGLRPSSAIDARANAKGWRLIP